MDRVNKSSHWGTVCSLLLTLIFSATLHAQGISFNISELSSASLNNPTSLQFGPDGRLYVAQQNGTIKAFTVLRNAANDYQVLATETIDLVKNNVQNHNDDGSSNSTNKRQITGLLVAGSASNPVLYVSSSDWRIAGGNGGNDANLDTNSGVISRLSCDGGISADACQSWDHVDLVRGLPRSEENHATNGMDLDAVNNILYVMSGGHANKGAPSNNFAGTPEYYLSAALLSVDLDMLESMPVLIDNSTTPATQYVYDLPTLDDPQRANVDGISDKSDPDYTGIDINDPFGGNNGLNQAVPEPDKPVQIHSPGYRNAYDVLLTESGDLYTWDNGPNGGWGGQPLIYNSAGVLQGVQLDGAVFDAAAGDYCTNEFSEAGSNMHGDQLHFIGNNYYGGHPAPIRAFPELSGIIVYEKDGSDWLQQGPTYTFSELLPDGLSIADFPNDPRQCDYQTNDPAKYLEKVSSSTNGIAEYLGTNFSGAMQGDILAAAFNDNIYRCKPDGAGGLVGLDGSNAALTNGLCEVLFENSGSTPLDITTLGDGAPFPGTVWVANITGNDISVFEPNDFLVCDPSDPTADSDGDGFSNGDEEDNGTDPCSAASKPSDFDGDGVSNLNDADDDNDGIDDVDDPFALDAQNGLGTSVPVDYPFFNTDPGTGLFGLGFTGLMLPKNGSTTWEELFDPGQLAAGGTSGLMTVENVTTGDAFGTTNSQENGFLFGVDIDTNTPPVTVSTRLLPPYFDGETPEPWQAFGLFIGTGDQDNYLKVVVNHNSGDGGVEVLLEDGDTDSTQYSNDAWGGADILSAGQVDLLISIDPQAGTAQPQVSLDQGATVFDLGDPLILPAGWLSPSDDQGLAVGLISTANGPGAGAPAYNAIWDFLRVELSAVTATGDWLLVDDELNEVRHEGGFVQAGDKFYLLGGRESQSVRIYDPAADSWSTGADAPILLHHFQAVELDGLIYVIGAMTGACCSEPEAPNVYIYDPLADVWATGPAIPAERARGGGAAVVFENRIYWISGNENGHSGPASANVDRFDPATGTFSVLADIPHPRDHFFAHEANGKIYAVAGRRSGEGAEPNPTFAATVPEVDVYDIASNSWTSLPASANIPTPRAAAASGLIGDEIIVAGGESGVISSAHAETEALDLSSQTWRSLSDMRTPRHAAQAIVSNNGMYVAAGSPQRGGPGGTELDLEALYLFGQTTPSTEPLTPGVLQGPESVDLGTVISGSFARQVVTLTNIGGIQALLVINAEVIGSPDFRLDPPFSGTISIAPGASHELTVVFEPQNGGGDGFALRALESATLLISLANGDTLEIPLQGSASAEPIALFRVNAGGTELASTDGGPAWTADTDTANSAYLVNAGSNNVNGFTVGSLDASVPASTPQAVFGTERWDNTTDAAGEMSWSFPTGNGDFRVRLHMMNGFNGTSSPGERVFDVAVEGSVPAVYNDIDLSDQFGHQVGGMIAHDVTVADGSLDLEFLHSVENPLVNAIEIVALDPGSVNQPPQVEPIDDQFSEEGDLSSVSVAATDSDGPDNLTYTATGLPAGLDIEFTNGQIFGSIADGAAAGSPYAVTIAVSDGADSTQINFTWNVAPASGGSDTVLYRINIGGDQVAAADRTAPDWAVDNALTPSALRTGGGTNIFSGDDGNAHAGTIDMTDASIPPSAPADMFNIERWDADAAPEMTWALPVTSGSQVEVRLYFAELFGDIDAAGLRVFDVSVEGSVPGAFDDIDPFAAAGAKGAFMRSTTLTMSDDTLDLAFIHDVQNPALKGIEVIELGAAAGNTPPTLTNPGEQNSTEGDTISLQLTASDADAGDTLSYSASGLPPDLIIDPVSGLITGTIATEGSGTAFAEQGGLVVIEMESAEARPANWVLGPDESPTSPNIDNPGAASNGQFLVWEGNQFLSTPGNGLMTYPIEISNPGTYRFQWRSQVGNGTSSTEHNDSWLKIEADAFFGEKAGGVIVCPKGLDPAQNDCAGNEPEGAGGNGWFKIYSSGSTNWTWSSNTSDNDPHQIFARFDAPGTYNILVSARSSSHLIDRMVLSRDDFAGNPQDLSLPESTRAGGAAAGSPYSVTVSVTDGITPAVQETFTWNVDPLLANTPPVADAGADQSVDEGAVVTLDGTGSSDADTDPLNYNWTQLSGPAVTLSDADTAMPSFTAPQVSSQQMLVFELTVDDGTDNASDTVTVTVNDVSTGGGGTLEDAQFEQVALPVTDGAFYTSVVVGPDDKLYALNINADIHRWSINADGTLADDEQVLSTINDVEASGRSAIGLAFDPAATAGNLIAWVTHVDGGQGGGDKFSGKITRLSGANLESAQDFVTGLPRSTGDHWVNSLAFGPAGDIYVNVGSMSAMGALDGTWNDTETLLSAATLRVDLDAITSPPVDVQTEAGGSYDPFASGAPVTVFGEGVRNAYDLVWHSNGFLYVPTNGSAPGNTPASDASDICPDGLNYSGPSVPALNGVSEQPDFLFKVEQGGYYGHPNPTLCNYVLNGGNPTAAADLNEVTAYPVGIDADADYVSADAVLDFAVFGQANSHSPNGVLEYQSGQFNGGLQGALLVARFHRSDIVAIRPDMTTGDIIETSAAIPGLSGLSNPLDVTEDPRNGNLYVTETQGAFTITLLRPLGDGVANIDADPAELIFAGVQGTAGDVESILVSNNGTADLDLSSVALTGANAADFVISADPSPVTLLPGEQATIEVQFDPRAGVTGSLNALLQINSSDVDEPTLEVALFGLSAQGLEGGGEPPLQNVVDTLGFAIDVGGSTLSIGGDPNPIGDEVPVSLFRKSAGDSPVSIEPVARYSPDWVLPFGWYQPNGSTPILNQVGELSGSSNPPEHQTLFPAQISGSMSFDPGAAVFGLYTTSPTHTAFTEDALNTGAGIEPHSARVYPLVDRTGNAVPNSFLVAFEEASNTDYQDYVFVIRNVLPAQPAGSGCAPISPLDCPQVAVNLPYSLSWDGDEGGVGDSTGVGTGLTMIDPPSNGTGYIPANLAVNAANSTLDISTTAGIQFGPTGNNPNSLDNGLGVAFDADVQTSLLETTLAALPAPPGGFAQAGAWLFLDESHYVKLVALSRDTGGWEIQLNYEQDNLTEEELESAADVAAAGDNVSLALDIDPVNNQVTGLYSINGGAEQMLGPIAVDPALLAGKLLPDGSGPHSFGGIFATQRNAAQQLFSFDDFALSFTGSAPNLPPLVTSPGNQQGLEGDVVSLQIAASDPDGDDAALSYAASGLPDGLSIDPASGLISGTIAAGTSVDSPFAVTVSVSDAADSTDVNFNWLVSEPGDINSGLLLHWPFDETGGLVAADASGNGRDGAVSASGASFVAGQLGNAIDLDGTNGFVADDDAEDYLNGLDVITVSTWVKADAVGTDEGIFTTAEPDNTDEFLAMRYDAAGFAGDQDDVIKTGVGNGEASGQFSVLESSANVQTIEWQHLALVWELGSGAQIYIDGVLNTPSDVAGTMASAINAVDRLWVGRASKFGNGEGGWNGLIDDFRIYGRALGSSEVLALANGQTGGGNTPPSVTNPGDQVSTEGASIGLQIEASDADVDDTLSYSASGLPDGLTIDPVTGLISGTVAAGAAAGSPFASEVTVDDGSDPVTIQFDWTVNEPAVPIASADVSITPAGGLTATTFNGDAFVISNNGDYPITSVSIDLSTALFADNVYDPVGDAGDAGAKCLTPNSGAAATGFVAPADACVDPFANPHDGGFEIMTINFTDFGPGESFGFNTDVDPTSIKNATGTGEAGAVSGLELSGSTVTVSFDDGNGGVGLTGQTFQIAPNSQGGSVAQLRQTAPAAPSLSASGLTLTDIDLASPAGASGPVSHAAASVPNIDSAQTLVIDTGSAGDSVRLLQVEAALLAVNGFELEPFEANEAIVVNAQTATTGADGTVSVPVTLTRTNPTVGGYNYFAAVVDGADGSSRVSNFIILRLESPAGGNQPPVANDDMVAITAGQQDVMIDLLANDSDVDGVLDASSIVIVDPPTQGVLTPGVLGVFEYDHSGAASDSFTYTVNDNEAATSNLATVFIQVQPPALPDDVDGDGDDNVSDNDDDNDGLFDTEDPFAIDADNGTGTDLPVRLPLFSDDPGTGLFGLGFTGLMSNGEIGGVQGDDYLDLFDPARIFVNDNPAGSGTLTIAGITAGDAFTGTNSQQDAFQIGLNVDSNSQPFVVHTRMLAPFFDDLSPQNFQSQGLFIGTGDQDNYLKMVLDGASNNIELLLEEAGVNNSESDNFGDGLGFLAADVIDLYLVVDPVSASVDARVALDDGPIQTLATFPIPATWLTPDDDFGLAAGLIATSNGPGPEFDATWDELAAFHLAADDQFDVLEDSGLNVLDVLANDFDEAGLTITAVGSTDNGGVAVVNGSSIDYTPAADFAGIETFTYTVENSDGIVATAVVAVNVLPVNDAPSVVIAGDQQPLEDAGAQIVADFASGFAPGGGADEAGQGVAGYVVSNDNNALFTTQPAIDVSGELSYESVPDANGIALVTVQAQDDGGIANGGSDLSAPLQFVIEVLPVNDAPAIELLGDENIDEDAGAQSVPGFAFNFNPGGGADESAQTIAGFVVSNDNNSLFALQPAIASDGTLSYTPADNANGVAEVTVTVLDDGGTDSGGVDQSAAQTFIISVAAQNDPPVITAPADVVIDEDQTAGPLSFSVADSDTDPGNILITFTSDNPGLLPNGNIVQSGSLTDRLVTLTPLQNQSGTAVITITANDGDGGISQAQFTLTVNAINDDPLITAPADVAIDEDSATAALAFAISDVETDAASLLVTASSSDQTLLPDGNIVLGGSGENRSVMLSPAADQSGTALITLTVTDADSGVAQGQFTLTVTAINDDPLITAPADVVIDEDSATAALAFAISDVETDAASLLVTASSSDQTLLPDGNIVLGGSGENRSVMLSPAADQSGTALITLTVTDADSGVAQGQFTLTVTAINDDPLITAPADVVTDEDSATAALAFAVSDVETAADSLIVSASSSDQTLLPDGNIVLGGSGENRTVSATPAADQNGTAVITLTVTDADSGVAQGQFTLTVNAVNDDPLITAPADVVTDEDIATAALAFAVSDVETAADSLIVSASSSDQTLLPDGNIVLGGSGENRSVSATPAADQNGTAVITLTVTDADSGSAQGQFTLTVNAVNDDPEITTPADLSIDEDMTSPDVALSVTDVESGSAALIVTASSSDQALVPDGNIIIGGNGSNRTVSVTPVADQNGVAVITLSVTDEDSGTAQTQFALTVNPVNDAPDIVIGSDQSVLENAAAQLVAGFASGFAAGGADDEVTQSILEFVVSNDNNALFAVQPAIAVDGSLSFTPAADSTGTATVSVQVRDDGGNANGGEDLSALQTFTISVNAQADLSISKVADEAIVLAGEALTWTITVNNAGPSVASNVVVTDVLPAGLANALTSGCVNDPEASPACQLGDIAAGDQAQFSITAQVEPDVIGELVNTATVTTDTAEVDTDNNAATATVSVNSAADLSLSKLIDSDPVIAGTTVNFTLTVSNAGPSTALDVAVTDVLDDKLLQNPTATGCVNDPDGLPACQLGDLEPGEEISFSISADLLSSATGILENTATVSSSTDDPDAVNNTASVTASIDVVSDLQITQIDSVDPVPAGAPLSYTISIVNHGPSDAINVTSGGVLPLQVTDPQVSACVANPNDPNGCSLGTLPAGEEVSYLLDVSVLSNANGAILENMVMVQSDTVDADAGNNMATENTAVVAVADLAIDKVSGTVFTNPESSIEYTITVSNPGPSDVLAARVIDMPPARLGNLDWMCVGNDGASCSNAAGMGDIDELVDLPAGSSVVFTLIADLQDDLEQPITNTASVVAPSDASDPSSANNQASDTDAIGMFADGFEDLQGQ